MTDSAATPDLTKPILTVEETDPAGEANLSVVTAVSHESLVATHLLRLQAGNPAPVVLSGVVTPTAEVEAAKAHALRATGNANLAFHSSGIIILLLSLVTLLTPLTEDAFLNVMLAGCAPMLLSIMGTGFVEDRARTRVAVLEKAQDITVPGPVAVAHRRVRSAATEIEDGDHHREVEATARLAAEGADEMVARIADHHTAGTLHTPAAQALVSEVCRLAAEMDSYLTVHNAHRFAPGEDETLVLVSATAGFTFAPAALAASAQPTPLPELG